MNSTNKRTRWRNGSHESKWMFLFSPKPTLSTVGQLPSLVSNTLRANLLSPKTICFRLIYLLNISTAKATDRKWRKEAQNRIGENFPICTVPKWKWGIVYPFCRRKNVPNWRALVQSKTNRRQRGNIALGPQKLRSSPLNGFFEFSV